MPSSPSLRFSSGREHRMEAHKRGHSFESGLSVKVKDDDLTLFNDMQMRERDNFLLCSNDDFDVSLSKLKHFSDFKLNIPVRGESSDLLNVGGEKNDYDWLLTPPETPLFPSLDDEEPAPINLVSRGRPRTQPINISTSSMTEKGHRTGRSSASPHRLSPSPRSGNNLPQSRGRPSSAPHSSTAPVLRPATPSRRPSTPPNKPSTPTPRSSTPTLRRMSTGSGGNISSSARRGASPVKASRGNSASPKLRGWQSNFPGFSSEPPPNLRTSISDRPASRVRGSSLASRNGRDSSQRSGRQSMSPTASRSVSSSQSNDRDHFSSHSKGSVASSCDDDVDLLHSVNVEISSSPTLRKHGVFVNSRTPTFSKKPSKNISASSAPKRSFDSALRQMDQRKTPQNMFRPLLSSVPASTFYIGKSNTMQRPMFSRNSSLTTSSNASSEQGASIPPDTEGSEHDQNDLAVEWEKMPDAEVHEEVFAFDNVDGIEDTGQEVCTEKPQNIHGDFVESVETNIGPKQLTSRLVDVKVTLPSSELSYAAGEHADVEPFTAMAICSKCNKSFRICETTDGKVDACQECVEKNRYVTDRRHATGFTEAMLLISKNSHVHPSVAAVVDEPYEKSYLANNVPHAFEINSKSHISQPQSSEERLPDCLAGVCPVEFVMGEKEQEIPDKELGREHEVASTTGGGKFQRLHSFNPGQLSRMDSPEGAGISVLLKRSNSGKGPVVQGRSLMAASIYCAEPSYTRDNANSSKGIVLLDSSSASSSVNLGSSRPTEAGIQRQLSSSSADTSGTSEPCLKSRSTETFLSVNSNNLHEGLALMDKLSCSVDNVNALNGYVTLETLSASSSVDLGSSRQVESCIQRQLSSSKNKESVRMDLNTRHRITEMFLSGVSINSQEDLASDMDSRKENFCGSTESRQYDSHGESLLAAEEHVKSRENTEYVGSHLFPSGVCIPNENGISQGESCMEMGSSICEFVTETRSALLENVSSSDILNDETCGSSVNVEDCHSQNMQSAAQEDMPAEILVPCPIEGHEIIHDCPCRTDISDVLLQSPSGVLLGSEDDSDSFKCSQTENEDSQSMSNTMDASYGHPVSQISEKDESVSGLESNDIHQSHGQSTITIEGQRGNKSRNLTLEEATDTILFCSSIIHDLAFKAAAIAIEKEQSPPTQETRRPTVMLLGKSAFDEKEKRRAPSKHTPKPRKARRKRLETDAMLPVAETGSVLKGHKAPVLNTELPNKADSTKPPKLESKCNCTVM